MLRSLRLFLSPGARVEEIGLVSDNSRSATARFRRKARVRIRARCKEPKEKEVDSCVTRASHLVRTKRLWKLLRFLCGTNRLRKLLRLLSRLMRLP